MKIQRLLEIDFLLLISTLILSFIGILFIYSSNLTSTSILVSNEHVKQMIWLLGGVLLLFLLLFFDYKRLKNIVNYLYVGMIFILIYTRLFGRVVNGARSWIGIGTMGIQPSEITKIVTIIFLAKYLDQSKKNQSELKRFVISSIILLIPVLLILSQPDLGTALVFFPILLIMVFIAGLPIRYISFLLAIVSITSILTLLPFWQQYILKDQYYYLKIFSDSRAISLFILIFVLISIMAYYGNKRFQKRYFYWISFICFILFISLIISYIARSILKDYQIMRLIVFLDPEVDPKGAGWNIIQSITAIGSGGLLGKGYLLGTQSHYRYLPQQSTDFIFSIYSEEWGFIGGIFLFSLYLIILWRLTTILKQTTDLFAAYIIAGLCGIYWFHFFINVGMTIGVMPITGIPLVFLSYGGSSLSSAILGIGLALSIHLRRYEH